jgi:hypothetical protein
MAHELEATMDTLRAATLHIALGILQTYYVVYTASFDGGTVVIPSRIYGREKLQALLNQLEIPSTEIDVTMAMVESQMSYTLDLGNIDKDKVASLLLQYGRTDFAG